MAKKKSKKASPKTPKKAPRAKSAPRKKKQPKKSPRLPKRAGPRRSGYGGNSVALSYDSSTSNFVAITTVDTPGGNITWTAMGVNLFDPNGIPFGAMNPDPADSTLWTSMVQNPTAGKWTAQANFQGNDNEPGNTTV